MDIRMDTESEEPYEEVVDEALVEVAEEPFIPDYEMQRAPPIAPKKKSRKKPLLFASIIFLVIVIFLIGWIFLPRAPSDLDLVAVDGADGHSMRLTALITSDSATESSGKAKVMISYDGAESYSNSNWESCSASCCAAASSGSTCTTLVPTTEPSVLIRIPTTVVTVESASTASRRSVGTSRIGPSIGTGSMTCPAACVGFLRTDSRKRIGSFISSAPADLRPLSELHAAQTTRIAAHRNEIFFMSYFPLSGSL